MQNPRGGWNVLVLILVLSLILSPRLIAGGLDLRSARQLDASGDATHAVVKYASAARRLFWRTDLWEFAGLTAMEAGESEPAIMYLEIAREHHSLSPDGWLALGDAYAGIGDTTAAISAWQEAGMLAPAFMRLAQAQRATGDLPAAIQHWQTLLVLEPGNSQAHYQLGLLLALTDPESALSELMQATSDPLLDPSVQAMRTSLNTALVSDDEPYRQVIIGRALAAQGEWDLAAVAFRRAVLLRTDYAPGWAWLGEAEQQLGRDGLPYLVKANQLDPQSAMAYILYGMYWQRQGQEQKMVETYQKAVQLEPDVAAWHIALGGAYEQNGDLPQAVEEYLRAIELDPADPSSWRVLALFCAINGYELSDTGLPAAQTLLQLAPDDWRSPDTAGQVNLTLGNIEEAQQQFEEAIMLSPTQPEPHLHLALVYLELGNGSMARQELETTCNMDPDGAAGWQAGRLLEQLFP